MKRQEIMVDPNGQLLQWMEKPTRRVSQEPVLEPVLFNVFGDDMSTDAIQNRKDTDQL